MSGAYTRSGIGGALLLSLIACSHRSHSNPKEAGIHFQVGLSLFEDKEYPKALEEFKKARALDDASAAIRMHVGLAYLKIEKLNEASQEIELACKMQDPFPECWNNLSYVELKRGHPREAATFAQKALQTDTYPTPETALENWALAQIDIKDFKGARKNLEHARRLKPESCSLRTASVLLLGRQGDWDEALRESRRTIHLCRIDPAPHLWEAYALYKLGQRAQAEAKYHEILNLFNRPDAADAARVALDRLKNRIPLKEPPQSLGES